MAEEPVYLYGIVRAPASSTPARKGVAGAPIRVVEERDVAAVVSDLPRLSFEARRDDLMAHSEVLQEVLAEAVVLPMSFGTVFASPAELVSAFLAPNHDALVRMLDRLDGSVEMQVKAEYDEAAVAREIASDRTVRKLQARARAKGDVAAKIELGRRFASVLDHKRDADGRAIVESLAPLARDVHVSDAAGDYGLVNASLLVPRSDVARLDSVVDGIRETLGGRAHVRCVGPLPPYSFVDAGELVAG